MSLETSTAKKMDQFIITGYLGSGKSTLIQHILKNTIYKVAVIQNEFTNEMGIEGPMMLDQNGEIFDKFMELPNGCLCCSAKDDLLKAIEFFLDGNSKYKQDYIIIETNGLADPSNTIKALWADDELEFPAKIKSINSVVSIDNIEKMAKDELFQRQIIFSDRILINKMDKLTDGISEGNPCNDQTREDTEQKKARQIKVIKDLNPLAMINETKYCKITMEDLFNCSTFLDENKHIESKLDNSLHIHPEKQGINFVVIEYGKDTEFDFDELEMRLGQLIWEKALGFELLRMKGIVNIKGEAKAYSVQGVDETFELVQSDLVWDKWQAGVYSKFLFIGKNIDEQALRDYLVNGK